LEKPIISRLDKGSEYILRLEGALSEDIDFSETQFPNEGTLIIELDQLIKINSCGIRNWIKWLEIKKPDQLKLIFRNCPKIFIEQLNVIKGIIPKGSIIESFYVPYYCEKDDSTKKVLYKLNNDFDKKGIKQLKTILCEFCQKPMELDALEHKYFAFLART